MLLLSNFDFIIKMAHIVKIVIIPRWLSQRGVSLCVNSVLVCSLTPPCLYQRGDSLPTQRPLVRFGKSGKLSVSSQRGVRLHVNGVNAE